MQFAGKVVIITGAERGLGKALALQLAKGGAKVVLTGIQAEALLKLQVEIRDCGGEAIHRFFDVSVADDASRMIADVIAELGRVDVLINNAGISQGGDIRLVSYEDWARIFEVNFWGAVRTARAVMPHMIERKSGYIVNVASGAGLVSPALWIPYSTSKFALVGLSEGLLGSLRPRGIGVSVVCTGWVDTKINQGLPPALVEMEGADRVEIKGERRLWRWVLRHFPGYQMTAETAARKIIRGIERERFWIYTHWWFRWVIMLRAVAPEIFAWIWTRVNAADETRHRLGEKR